MSSTHERRNRKADMEMKYLPFFGLILACAIAMSTCAGAVEVTVGGTKIEFAGPKGYCALDGKHEPDSKVFALYRQMSQGHNELLAMFTPCGLLKAWHAGQAPGLADTFQYYVNPMVKDRLLSALTVAGLCRDMRKPDPSIAEAASEMVAKKLEKMPELSKKVELKSFRIDGVLLEDDTGCYVGQTMKASFEGKPETTGFGITGITVVRNKLITSAYLGELKDRETVNRMLAITREALIALHERNR